MGRLGDRLGKYDDDSVIYRADDAAQKVDGRRMAVAYVGGSALAALLIAAADLLFGQPVGALAGIGLTVVLLTLYVSGGAEETSD